MINMKQNVFLAIDYGTKRLGLAISRGTLADPLMILPHNEELFSQLKRVCKENEVSAIVIGISEGEMEQQTRSFATELQQELPLPIFYADETLSSSETKEKLMSLKKKKRSGPLDHYAAATFLQNWLDGSGSL